MAIWKAAPARAGAAVMGLAWAVGLAGCSSSSTPSSGGPSSDDLIGPSQGVAFCTLTCRGNGDCPSGTICNSGLTFGKHCLKACTSDSDCTGGFTCRASAGVCWSPYNGADAPTDAGGTKPVDSGGGGEAAPPDASGTDAGGTDGGADAPAD